MTTLSSRKVQRRIHLVPKNACRRHLFTENATEELNDDKVFSRNRKTIERERERERERSLN